MLSASTLPSPCTLPTAASTPRSASLLPAAPQTFAAYQPTSDADKGGQRDARAGPELTGPSTLCRGPVPTRSLVAPSACDRFLKEPRPLPVYYHAPCPAADDKGATYSCTTRDVTTLTVPWAQTPGSDQQPRRQWTTSWLSGPVGGLQPPNAKGLHTVL
ncbi:hypothetical protein C0Q70_11927 [Pomacea canaliculata]|uniref:Uncharacterized protein n=1 Tax=Pomacea canaliculata TaxID=400727 RepID=A0A2T7P7F3_POMCA|nr:hypothetical protein C0Q70_11927 [Pomacea canaliculata]